MHNANGKVIITAAPEGLEGYIGHSGEARLSQPGDDPLFGVRLDNGVHKMFRKSQLRWISGEEPTTVDAHPRIIGLSGFARAGKDTVADIVKGTPGEWVGRAFADPIREMAAAINPQIVVTRADPHFETLVDLGADIALGAHHIVVRYNSVMAHLGYTAAKEIPEVRRILQVIGTEAGRDVLGADIWAETLAKRAKADLKAGKSVVVTDVRFINEVAALSDLAERLDVEFDWWEVRRTETVPTARPAHASEHLAWDLVSGRMEPDGTIFNDDSLKALTRVVEIYVAE